MDLLNNGNYPSDSQSWLGAVDVGYLTEEERDQILAVLWRDEKIRKAEKSRVTKLKSELRDVKRKGAKNAETSYSNRVCARCNRSTGLIFNASAQCPVCKHKVCKQCQMNGFFSRDWKCVVCYKEAQLKAETGEWFYGMMKPELRALQDGTTLVKQAVTTKSIHFDERSEKSQPATMTSPSKSSAHDTSRNGIDFLSVSSVDTEGTGSSTESRKHRNSPNKSGPAETGSIRSLRTRKHSPSKSISDPTVSPQHSSPNSSSGWRNKSLPVRSPRKPPRMIEVTDEAVKQSEYEKSSAFHMKIETDPQRSLLGHSVVEKQNRNDEFSRSGDDRIDGDQASLSSVDSKSVDIDKAVAEYVSQQEELEKQTQDFEEPSESYSSAYSGVKESKIFNEMEDLEANDEVLQLPSPMQRTTLPRKLNQKLVEQNKFSQSVPNVSTPQSSQGKSKAKVKNAQGEMQDNDSTSSFLNRNLSTSIPDFMKSTTSLNSTNMHDLSISGEIRFFLKFNYKTNILLVNIVDCRNLATADKKRGRSDPYVKCYLLPDRKNKQKTDVKKRTFAPVYNKCLKFTVSHSELSTRILELSVWHAGTFTRNLFLGQVQLPLDTWDWESSNQNWYPLRQRETISTSFVRDTIYKGDLIVGLKYLPPGSHSPSDRKAPHGELNILIKQAKNLTLVRSGGTLDAFVKIMLQPDKQFRQKTSVIPKNTSPEWNYNVRMQLYQPMEECGLQLSIWHKEKIQGSTFLGGSRLNLGPHDDNSPKWMDAVGMEVGLWQAAINTPGTWVDGSLSLRPRI